MTLVCEISIEAYCRPIDVVRRLIIHAPNRMSPIVTTCGQFWPIYNVYSPRQLALEVRLT
jgi:hypothetical protein